MFFRDSVSSILKAQVKKLSKLKLKTLPYYTKHSDSTMADNEKPEGKEKEEQQQDVELVTWRKKIEMIGIDIKSLDRENETRRLKLRTTLMNQHFINELDKIGLQLIKITVGSIFTRGLLVLLEPKSTKMLTE
jgi:sialic acid synthase SpsE